MQHNASLAEEKDRAVICKPTNSGGSKDVVIFPNAEAAVCRALAPVVSCCDIWRRCSKRAAPWRAATSIARCCCRGRSLTSGYSYLCGSPFPRCIFVTTSAGAAERQPSARVGARPLSGASLPLLQCNTVTIQRCAGPPLLRRLRRRRLLFRRQQPPHQQQQRAAALPAGDLCAGRGTLFWF